MRVSLHPATCVASLLVVASAVTFVAAQGPGGTNRPSSTAPAASAPRQAPNGTNVAVVDIGYIFKNHNIFNTKLIELNERGSRLDGEIRSQQRNLVKMKDELAGYKAGSPEYKQLEERLTKAAADFDLNRRRQQQEFFGEEAKLYYETYNQIEQTIAVFAAQANIRLVLRHSKEPMKPDVPETVKLGIMRPIVFENGLDITGIILAKVNEGTTKPPQMNKTGAASPGPTAQTEGDGLPPRTATPTAPGRSGSKLR